MATEISYGARDNLFNVMNVLAPDGTVTKVARVLTETNHFVQDLNMLPANGGRTHRGSRQESIPQGQFCSLGQGWVSSFGRFQPFVANTCILRNRYEIPTDVLHAQRNPGAYRTEQEATLEEGMSQTGANSLLYGNDAAAPEKIDGIFNMKPWNDLGETDYVYDVGGSAYRRSVLLVNPGNSRVHLIYPAFEENAGLKRTDMGEKNYTTTLDANDTSGGERIMTRTEYEWMFGIVINDQRAVKRICNINWTLASRTTDLIEKILQARLLHEIGGQWFLYCEARIYTQLVVMAGDKHNVIYSTENPYRVKLPMIGDIIIRRMDALRYTVSGVETAEPEVTDI